MIPKIIHYCWFGGKELPELARRCIESWKKYLPDYEIRQWDESNFDVHIIPYTHDAYEAHKYAFVSDYARFWVLYQYGGLYFDTDVEMIKNMDAIVQRGAFMGCEHMSKPNAEPASLGVAPGLGLGFPPHSALIKELLDFYQKYSFYDADGTIKTHTVVTITTGILCKKGLINTPKIQEIEGVFIYPKEYFCPKEYLTNELTITDKTVSIHHYDGSWLSDEQRYALNLQKKLSFLPNNRVIARNVALIKYHGLNAILNKFKH